MGSQRTGENAISARRIFNDTHTRNRGGNCTTQLDKNIRRAARVSLSLSFREKALCHAHLIIGTGRTVFFTHVRAPIRSVNDTTLFTLLIDHSSIALDDDAAVSAKGGIEGGFACWVITLDRAVVCLQRELIFRHRVEWLELSGS